MTPSEYFDALPVHYQEIGRNRVAYRRCGVGPVLLLVHGWPFHGACWRHMLPALSERFDCIIPDAPGLGLSEWEDASDLRFHVQAQTLRLFLDELGVQVFAAVAHDSGATITRLMVAGQPDRCQALVLLNTEMPGHRPPYIELFQRAVGLPGSTLAFRLLLRSETFLSSALGFGGCFSDPTLLNEEFRQRYVVPLLGGPEGLRGVFAYLRGVEWELVDGMVQTHARITAPVKLIWGAADVTFPVELAQRMATQFPQTHGLDKIPGAAFLVHEEKPRRVLELLLEFFALTVPAAEASV